MSRTKRPSIVFIGSGDVELPTTAMRMADRRKERHGADHQLSVGEFWRFECDMRAAIAKLFASFADEPRLTDPRLFITGELAKAQIAEINRHMPGAFRAQAQHVLTRSAGLFFSLRVGDVVAWAVDFAATWAHIAALTSNEYLAVEGEGFQATARTAVLADAKSEWRDDLRRLAIDFVEPFIRDLHGRPGRTSNRERDLEAKAFRNRTFQELEAAIGKQRAMEIAKRETMAAFNLKTTKQYRNAMERKERAATTPRRRRPQEPVN